MIALIVHAALCLCGIILCLVAKEKKWWLVFALCCIPFIGPLLIITSFVYYQVIQIRQDVHIQNQSQDQSQSNS